jgi:rhodanese-related sulfurtransferase
MSRFNICRLVIAMALSCLAGTAFAQEADVSPRRAHELAVEGKLLLIDVRTPEEWRQTGVPVGALHINLRDPAGPAAFVEHVLSAVGGDKTRPVGVICRTGSRSVQAQKLLLANGFTNVANVSEGVMGNDTGPGWLKDGLPVEPCPSC